jgi:hypothetical protein
MLAIAMVVIILVAMVFVVMAIASLCNIREEPFAAVICTVIAIGACALAYSVVNSFVHEVKSPPSHSVQVDPGVGGDDGF